MNGLENFKTEKRHLESSILTLIQEFEKKHEVTVCESEIITIDSASYNRGSVFDFKIRIDL